MTTSSQCYNSNIRHILVSLIAILEKKQSPTARGLLVCRVYVRWNECDTLLDLLSPVTVVVYHHRLVPCQQQPKQASQQHLSTA